MSDGQDKQLTFQYDLDVICHPNDIIFQKILFKSKYQYNHFMNKLIFGR